MIARPSLLIKKTSRRLTWPTSLLMRYHNHVHQDSQTMLTVRRLWCHVHSTFWNSSGDPLKSNFAGTSRLYGYPTQGAWKYRRVSLSPCPTIAKNTRNWTSNPRAAKWKPKPLAATRRSESHRTIPLYARDMTDILLLMQPMPCIRRFAVQTVDPVCQPTLDAITSHNLCPKLLWLGG